MVQTLDTVPQLRREGAVATLTLSRPQRANRLGVDDIATLRAHLDTIATDATLRLVVLRGEGPQFCAGFQIDALGSVDATGLFDALGNALEALPQLTLVVVQGGCWGGAVDLALACDFRVGGPAAVVGIPAARLGLHFYANGMRRLVSRIGLGGAKQLLLAGQSWSGESLVTRGFLDAQDSDVDALAEAWVSQLLSLAPLAQQGMKRHLHAVADGRMDLDALQQDMARCAASSDLAEGLAAWRERRAPQFSGQ